VAHDLVILDHFPKHLFSSVLKYLDDIKYLRNSHLLLVKSPVVGLCIIEPSKKETYHVLKTVGYNAFKLDDHSKMVQIGAWISYLNEKGHLVRCNISTGEVNEESN
jgi:hypothetical protein